MPIPKKQEHVQQKSAKTIVYEALRDWIVDGTLQPGEKILDSEISQYFNVSRTPVREAMQMLSDQKLIDVYPGKGSLVSKPGSVNAAQIYRMIAELHALALEFSFPRINASVIAELRKLNDRFQSLTGSRHDQTECRLCDKEFHNTFITLADNAFITDFNEILTTHVARLENIYFNNLPDIADSADIHGRIIDALERRDLAEAVELMRGNWIHTAEVLKTMLPDVFT